MCIFLAALFIVTGCKEKEGSNVVSQDNPSTTAVKEVHEPTKFLSNGYGYTMHTNNAGAKPQPGQVVSLDFQLLNPAGVILDDSRNPNNTPSVRVPAELDENAKRNPMLAMINLMSAGDSATVKVPVDSLPTLPPNYREYGYLDYVIKVYSVEDQAAYDQRIQKEQIEQRAAAKFKEEAAKKDIEPLFSNYMKGDYAAKTSTLETGVKVALVGEGTGPKPTVGQTVTVHYYGFLKDGTSFDNSYKVGRPYDVTLGQGSVIRGWEEGLLHVPEGAAAILDIPWSMAYGETGNAVIPAKADLIFYVKIEGIK